jgi:hypothetical protein
VIRIPVEDHREGITVPRAECGRQFWVGWSIEIGHR